ncbi:MAG: hypothetical protein WBQ08_04100 [Candidatus Sulfotelmatobacter sp.]
MIGYFEIAANASRIIRRGPGNPAIKFVLGNECGARRSGCLEPGEQLLSRATISDLIFVFRISVKEGLDFEFGQPPAQGSAKFS